MSTIRILALAFLLAGCTALGDVRSPGQADFARVSTGMTRDDTRHLLGTPLQAMRFSLSGTESWDYLFQDSWGYQALFSVVFGPQGGVIGTTTARINDGGDHGK